jgi:hypothetical protein
MWTRANLNGLGSSLQYAGAYVPEGAAPQPAPGGPGIAFPAPWPAAPMIWQAPNPQNTGLMESPPAPPSVMNPFGAYQYGGPYQPAATPAQAATQPATTTVAPITLVSPLPSMTTPPPDKVTPDDTGGMCAVNGWVNSHPLLAVGLLALVFFGGRR